MAVEWTREQQKAIDLPSGKGNILVSAAAGSGKTAVLVERIFQKIAKEKIDINKFLVVTFTEAAAAEMKAKIENRFISELEKCSVDEAEFWRKQINLTDMAEISTIDSFCLNVLRNNYHNIGLDPNFKILDDSSEKLYSEKVVEELFDELYDKKDKDFLMLVEQISSFKNDKELEDVVKTLYTTMSFYGEADEFERISCELYSPDRKIIQKLLMNNIIYPEARYYKKVSRLLFNEFVSAVTEDNCLENSELADDLHENYRPIADLLNEICDISDGILSSNSIEEAYLYACKPMTKLPDCRGEHAAMPYYKDFKKKANDICEGFKNGILIYNNDKFSDEKMSEYAAGLKQTLEALLKVVRLYGNKMSELKNKRAAYSFNDIERLTYKLFKGNEDIRNEYIGKYYEILIDEYQDTNGLQDAIFETISRNNIFVVGDLKQSIYKFRGGDPYIFKGKSLKYAKESNAGTKVDLSTNFRSRSEVIDSVNSVFDAVMSDKNGDVEYTDNERLIAGMKTEPDSFYISELHVLEKSDEYKDCTETLIEAEHIAKYIKNNVGHEFFDQKNNIKRELSYNDFCILLSSTKNNAAAYSSVFKKNNIPLTVELADYFQNTEVLVMTSLISVIDNVRQDVPLVTVLRSAMFNFTDSQLAHIKINYGDYGDCFYDRICKCANSDGILSGKCKRVVVLIRKWRDYIRQHGVASLIWNIYEETGFYDCAAVAGGEKAQANLRLLYERAKLFEETGFKGLFSFVKYIKNLMEKNERISGARGFNNNSVRLMTMHKSKGLEFPVVILGGLGGKIRTYDNSNDVSINKDIGIGLNYYDVENECLVENPYNYIIKNANAREYFSERIRLLYVAMTRAQYKLVAVGTKKYEQETSFEEQRDNTIRVWKEYINNGKIDENTVSKMRKYIDIIGAVAVNKDSVWKTEFFDVMPSDDDSEEQTDIKNATDADALKENVYRLLDYKYPYIKSTVIPSRTTATEIKQLHNTKHIFTAPSKPLFMSDKKNAAKRGTAYHNAVQYIDLERLKNGVDTKTVNDELERLCNEGYVNREYLDGKTAEKIVKLFKSEQGIRMLNAKKVYRERNFQILVDSDVYDNSLLESETEKMILQGVIDCFFIENDGNVVLMDYKTDKITDGDVSAAVRNYTMQLELYSRAIKEIMNIDVKERYLYLFDINKAVKI